MGIKLSHVFSGCAALALLLLAGCGSVPTATDSVSAPKPARSSSPVLKAPSNSKPDAGLPVLPPANSGRGGYYQDDGPGDAPPPNLADVPDADVRNDPLIPRSNRPYVVFGKTYTPITDNQPYTQIGIGSWYGKKFHGQRTSSGELYDMYKMTAAHPTLPIPSYARLTNLLSGAVVIVRVNDRGPFHSSRAIDVSYTAALKLGLLGKGSHELQIDRILPEEVDRMLATRAGVSATVAPRLASQSSSSSTVVGGLGSGTLRLTAAPAPEQALVLAPKAVPGAGSTTAPTDIETMMRSDVAPAANAASGGFYLQLGAYARAENADAVRNKLAGTRLQGLAVVQGGAVHRLFSGPYASRQEALQAAQGLPAGLSLKPIVVQR